MSSSRCSSLVRLVAEATGDHNPCATPGPLPRSSWGPGPLRSHKPCLGAGPVFSGFTCWGYEPDLRAFPGVSGASPEPGSTRTFVLSQDEGGNPHPDPLESLASFKGQGEAGSYPPELLEPSLHLDPANLRGAIATFPAPPVCPPLPQPHHCRGSSHPTPRSPLPCSPSIYKGGGLSTSVPRALPRRGQTRCQSGQGGLCLRTLPSHPASRPREQRAWPGRSCSVAGFGL